LTRSCSGKTRGFKDSAHSIFERWNMEQNNLANIVKLRWERALVTQHRSHGSDEATRNQGIYLSLFFCEATRRRLLALFEKPKKKLGTFQGHHITTSHATQHTTTISYIPVAYNSCGRHCKWSFLYIRSSNCIGIHMGYRYGYSTATCCIQRLLGRSLGLSFLTCGAYV
jgi:hypothetical protein